MTSNFDKRQSQLTVFDRLRTSIPRRHLSNEPHVSLCDGEAHIETYLRPLIPGGASCDSTSFSWIWESMIFCHIILSSNWRQHWKWTAPWALTGVEISKSCAFVATFTLIIGTLSTPATIKKCQRSSDILKVTTVSSDLDDRMIANMRNIHTFWGLMIWGLVCSVCNRCEM